MLNRILLGEKRVEDCFVLRSRLLVVIDVQVDCGPIHEGVIVERDTSLPCACGDEVASLHILCGQKLL